MPPRSPQPDATPRADTARTAVNGAADERLEALIPNVHDPAARAELETTMQVPRQNIRRVESRLSEDGSPEPTLEAGDPPTDASALIPFILRRYHEVHRRQLPELVDLATEVEAVHADHPEVPRGLAALLRQIHAELLDHMAKEEGVVFPMLLRRRSAFVTHPICVMMSEHEEHVLRLAQLMSLTREGTPPADACSTWVRLCTATRRFADDLRQHVRLENEVLFPQFDRSLATAQ